jgi:ABC-type sugar transport system ATPase subunit
MLNREPDYARNQQRLHVALNGDTITTQAPLSLEIRPGQKVWIRIPLKTLYLFDEQTEKRLVP